MVVPVVAGAVVAVPDGAVVAVVVVGTGGGVPFASCYR